MTRARGEPHRFDGQVERVEVDESSSAPREGTTSPPDAAADNASQAARAARVRASRRRRGRDPAPG